jgi:hypothetical protein
MRKPIPIDLLKNPKEPEIHADHGILVEKNAALEEDILCPGATTAPRCKED